MLQSAERLAFPVEPPEQLGTGEPRLDNLERYRPARLFLLRASNRMPLPPSPSSRRIRYRRIVGGSVGKTAAGKIIPLVVLSGGAWLEEVTSGSISAQERVDFRSHAGIVSVLAREIGLLLGAGKFERRAKRRLDLRAKRRAHPLASPVSAR
jgi:hypothetical protein